LRTTLTSQGWNCGESTTHIVPVILGHEEDATRLSEILQQNGILVPAIRPPTVPRGTSRLRISLSAAHSESDIDRLLDMMGTLRVGFTSPAALAS
jgi:8-amino-7-oxononanoate synthase